MNAKTVYLEPDEDGVLVPSKTGLGHALGLVELTNDEYHSGPGVSKSHLDAIADASPLHYWAKYINPERVRAEPTEAMILGSAVHSAVLEPDLFPLEYITAPEDAPKRATKAQLKAKKPSPDAIVSIEYWEAFEKENAGRTILEPKDYANCLAIRDAVYRHPDASGLLTGGNAEQSFYAIDPDTGELIKCRTDYMSDMIVDLKATQDASPSGFAKSVANFRYDVQVAWYNHVLDCAFGDHPETWAFLAVESAYPHAIGIHYLDSTDVMRAKASAMRDLARIAHHRKIGVWPDYGISDKPLTLPNWVKR